VGFYQVQAVSGDRIVMIGVSADSWDEAQELAEERLSPIFSGDPGEEVLLTIQPLPPKREHWGEDDEGNPDLHPGLRSDCPHPLCQDEDEGP
jgi:hypothetical protein